MPERPRRVPARLAVGLLIALALAACSASPAPAVRASGAPSASSSPTARPDTARAAGLQDPAGTEDAVSAARSVVPTRIVIPRIGVDASLLDLHRGADGALVAPPADQLDKAGWYAEGTVPGSVGPAVIAGHVDWVDRVAVFHRLGQLHAGDTITVRMSDRSSVRFTVDRTIAVSKFHFPSKTVYGPTPDAQLRVITCGGPWDDARNIYSENVIVFASRTA